MDKTSRKEKRAKKVEQYNSSRTYEQRRAERLKHFRGRKQKLIVNDNGVALPPRLRGYCSRTSTSVFGGSCVTTS